MVEDYSNRRGGDKSISDNPESEGMVTKRTIVCQNCHSEWETTEHPDSYSKCPKCDADNNVNIRQIIFWKGKDGSPRKQFS